MCTSFFAFDGPHPLVGMNYDYHWEHPYKLALTDGGEIFSMRMPFGSRFGRPLGVTRSGIAADTQLTNYCPEGRYGYRRMNPVTVPQTREEILLGRVPPAQIGDFLAEHTLQYPRRHVYLHTLAAAKDGTMCVVEPGRPPLLREDFPDGFALMTNFNLYDRTPIDREMRRIACKRYKKLYPMLLENRQGIERGFEAMEAAHQTTGQLPTVFTLVTELDSDKVYFSLYGDYSRRFCFSFGDNMLRTERGFREPRAVRLTSRGIWASELMTWK